MAYHRHNPLGEEHPGYHGTEDDDFKPFLEEDEKKYSHAKYDSKDDPLKGGYRAKEEEEEKRKKEMTDFEKQVDEEHKPKYDKDNKNKVDDEEIKRKAAEEINKQMQTVEGKEVEKKKKENKSIEEAIEKAVIAEKKVIHLNR